MNPYDNIETYINGQLTSEELEIMETAIAKDEKLRQLVQEYESRQTVRGDLLRKEMAALVKREDNKTSLSSTRRRWWLIVLIGLMLIIGGYYIYQYMQK